MVSVQNNQEKGGTHEDQGGVEVLVVLLHVLGIVLDRFSSVHCIEIELGIIVLDGLEVHPQGLLYAVWRQPFSVAIGSEYLRTHHRGSMLTAFTFSPLPVVASTPPIVVSYCGKGMEEKRKCARCSSELGELLLRRLHSHRRQRRQ